MAKRTLYKKGQVVEWSWGQGKARGKVVDSFTKRVTRTLQGTEVKRNADEDNPAYLIKQDDGSQVLKSHSELERAD